MLCSIRITLVFFFGLQWAFEGIQITLKSTRNTGFLKNISETRNTLKGFTLQNTSLFNSLKHGSGSSSFELTVVCCWGFC